MACNVIYSLPCEIRLHILYYDYNVDAIGVLSHCMYQHVQIVQVIQLIFGSTNDAHINYRN